MNYIGDFVEDDVVYFMFNTFTSDDPSASCTITNFANTDIHIHKDDGLTQRNNAAGVTVSVNFDGITGSHLIKIDTSDNTVAGFFVTGKDYFVRAEGTTIDGATVNAMICHFSIQNRYTRGTNSAALATTALSDATWTDAKAVHLDANISSRNATTPPTVTAIRQEMDANSTRLDADISSRSSHDAAAVKTAMEAAGSKLTLTLEDTADLQGNQAAWATATGFSTHTAANVWAAAARTLTANTNFNDLNAAAIKAEVVAALADIKLDHLLNIAVDTDWGTTVHLDSVIGHMADVGGAATYDRANESMEALRARGDAAWISATGFSTHSAADVKTAMEAAGSKLTLTLEDTADLQANQGNWATAAGFSTHSAADVKTAMEGAGTKLTLALEDTADLQANQGAWATAVGFSTHAAADVKTAIEAAGSSIALMLADTNELQTDWKNTGRLDNLLDACNTTTPPTVGAIRTEMEGAGTKLTLALEDTADLQGNQAAWATATGFSTHSAADVKTAVEQAGSSLAQILADTNEMELDLKNGGRLDLILDIIAADTTTDIPAKVLKYIQLIARSDAAIATDNATELTAINADGGSGAGDFSNQTDAEEAIRDRGDAAWSAAAGTPSVLIDTTINVATDQTHFTLIAGSDVDDAYKDQAVVIYDVTNSDFPSVRKCTAYTGASKTVTLDSAPDFTIAAADKVKVFVTAPGTSAPSAVENAIAVWDRVLTGATHNIATSAGRRVREIGAFAISSGTAQAGNSHSITIAATASPANATYHGIFNRNLIVLTDNTGVGQTRTIVDYDAVTKVIVVDRDWRIAPDATTAYQITPDDTPLTVDHGVARGGTATTITIRTHASSVDDAYLCNIVTIIAGKGRGQARLVGGYDGTSNIVTICGDDWVEIPDTTSVYVMMPYGVACAACVGDVALAQINAEVDTAISDVNLHKHDQNMKAIAFSEY